ncbi:MAG TPA: hypothetical protein EYP85_03165 [Armatimonadetes bacterium]|nr:hypothetical protein [Armatimonadota bacterium]
MRAPEVKAFARQWGADLVGIASRERFEGVEPQRHPAALFPETKAVIAIGRAITRGTLRGIEEGTNWGLYADLGLTALSEFFLPHVTYHLTRFLEDHGWEAVPIFPHPPEVGSVGCPPSW